MTAYLLPVYNTYVVKMIANGSEALKVKQKQYSVI
jgi:hypothetical protein